jgi:tRNA isopentenyl-2-thiomethyl-A-37 hydroxylase MiaE
MKIGSYEHKKLFCHSLVDSHIPYSPESRPWPILDALSVERVQSVPFWGEVLRTQHHGAQIVGAFAQTIKDPMVKEAVMLQGEEQKRFTAMIRSFLSTHNIPSSALPSAVVPKKLEAAFMEMGYRKCLDLFLADGLRVAARRTNFIPEDLDQYFDSLLAEQSRHTIFLVNWMAYQRIKLNKRWGELNAVPVLWNRSGSLTRLMAAFGTKDEDERSLATRWMTPFSAEAFLTLCLSEHQKRMQGVRPELLQPQLSANLANVAREAFKVWPQRRARPTVNMLKP